MRIDKNEMIAGLPILKVRDWLRKVRRPYGFEVEHIAAYFNFSERKAGELMRELKQRGLIELMDGKPGEQGYHHVTMAGNALAMARAMPPITRAKAEQLLTGFLSRVVQVNSRDEFAYYVHEARVFGSYLDETAKDFGDVDIAVDVSQRKIEGRDIVRYSEARARQSGRHFGSWLDMLAYAEIEVWRILKARKAYLSLHTFRDIDATGARNKVVYRAPNESRFNGVES
jgi:predicted nucleotidyltransferase